MKKYICIHGHFYQPPRENAWLGEIERQPSAAPFHDWNERISSECYFANANSRILNDKEKIVAITNNYARMSFNFGPTLLQWLEREQPPVHEAIVAADRLSREHFGGHGSAMAQVYNHLIMPLANRRDKETQVRWGIEDFRYRFGRHPEGMWLAETAVDTETLEVLAAEGIEFTVLAPRQCKAVRRLGTESWSDQLDTRRPYRCQLPSGRSINLFFYDGDRSQAIAFRGLLNDGKAFANSLLSGFDESPEEAQLVHVATDGESYGHHHRHGDMALAYCHRYLETQSTAELTNYAAFLAAHPPTHEAQIHQNSSWSCVHGVERWRADCGCSTGGHAWWNQKWRQPLRQSLDTLRDTLASLFEEEMAPFTSHPWQVRDAYIEVLTGQRKRDAFLQEHLTRKLDEAEKLRMIYLLEMQHHALLMFTSCGWFFDDISRIETVQILQYARRAIQLAARVRDNEQEAEFLRGLVEAKSNVPEQQNGAKIYERQVLPAQFNLVKVGMHYAAAELLEEAEPALQLANYECQFLALSRSTIAAQRLLWGEVQVRSRVTQSEDRFYFLLVYLGDQHLFGRAYRQEQPMEPIREAFEAGNLAKVMQRTQRIPEGEDFSFFELRPEARRQFLQWIVRKQVQTTYQVYERVHTQTYNLLNLLHHTDQEIPPLLLKNLEWVLQYRLEETLRPCSELVDTERFRQIARRYQKWGLYPDSTHFNYLSTDRILCLERRLHQTSDPAPVLCNLNETFELLWELRIFPALRQVQNTIYDRIREAGYRRYDATIQEALRQLALTLHFDESCFIAPLSKNH